ncbi:MAG: hypothetical protein HQL57_02185 [Magnetococcales bacterium]|nr:hypothetical protein [Magnetococcales bacterium]MBF0155977.1 hypothetical protein [Magnetococcales bacterium]
MEEAPFPFGTPCKQGGAADEGEGTSRPSGGTGGGGQRRGGGKGGGKRTIGVRLKSSGMTFRVTTGVGGLAPNDWVVLDTPQGEQLGRVMFVSQEGRSQPETLFPGNIRRVVRKCREQELVFMAKRPQLEREARLRTKEAILKQGLPMRLAQVEFTHSGNKAIVHFTSESRVDFRDLVRQLAEELNTRVEMRQIGVRDETRLVGGIGPCGQPFCCARYQKKFHQVSVRMAKNQDLSLNPDSISGVCGRLRCCLAYENDIYLDFRKSLPKPGTALRTKDGREVIVKAVHPLSGRLEVEVREGGRDRISVEDCLWQRGTAETPEVDPSTPGESMGETLAPAGGEVAATPDPSSWHEQGGGSETKARADQQNGTDAETLSGGDRNLASPSAPVRDRQGGRERRGERKRGGAAEAGRGRRPDGRGRRRPEEERESGNRRAGERPGRAGETEAGIDPGRGNHQQDPLPDGGGRHERPPSSRERGRRGRRRQGNIAGEGGGTGAGLLLSRQAAPPAAVTGETSAPSSRDGGRGGDTGREAPAAGQGNLSPGGGQRQGGRRRRPRRRREAGPSQRSTESEGS